MRSVIDERDQLLKQKDNLCDNYKDTKRELIHKVSMIKLVLLYKKVHLRMKN